MGFRAATEAYQRKLIEQALGASKNNLKDAAALLKISRHALRHQATLSVEDQVRVLVDLATDPASLGRHWCGLTLWV